MFYVVFLDGDSDLRVKYNVPLISSRPHTYIRFNHNFKKLGSSSSSTYDRCREAFRCNANPSDYITLTVEKFIALSNPDIPVFL